MLSVSGGKYCEQTAFSTNLYLASQSKADFTFDLSRIYVTKSPNVKSDL